MVTTKLKHPEALAVSANVINNPPLSFLHYHIGALHPYFPEVPDDLDLNTLLPLPEGEEKEESGNTSEDGPKPDVEDESGTEAGNEATIVESRSIPSWRASDYPYWEGPANFEWSLDYRPPSDNHRWLRVQDDKALNRTPVAKLTYAMWGPTYESWAIAAQQHYSLLENIERGRLDAYKFEKPWDMKGERIRINALAILGSDVLDSDVWNWPDNQGDEDMIVINLPRDLGRR